MQTVQTTIFSPAILADVNDHLTNKFKELKGCRMMTLTIVTEPRLRAPKSNPLTGRVVKVQQINGAVGYNYAKAVNRQKVKDGSPPDFEAWKRRNMTHVGGAVIQNDKTGEYYVFLRPLSNSDPIYYVDGQLTELETIEDKLYFPPKKNNGGRQKVSKEVPYINVKICNIHYVKGF